MLIHTPHRDKKRGTERTLALDRARSGFPPERVLIDHNNEETLPLVLDAGCWAGHSIYPNTKMDEARMVALVKQYGAERIIVNSAADWGVSDPLKVPKTVAAMREAGIADARHRDDRLEEPGRLLRAERPARSRQAPDRSARAVRGQLGAARRTDTRGRAGVGALLAGRIERRCSSGY